jgi:hypothetical protein
VKLDQRAVPIAQTEEQRVLALGLEESVQKATVLDLAVALNLVLVLDLVLAPLHQPIGNDEWRLALMTIVK